jgi:hypothetical protein
MDPDGRIEAETVRAGIDVFVCVHNFKDEDEALDYAVACRRDRRNLTRGELYSLVKAVHNRRPRGGDRKSEDFKSSNEDLNGKQAAIRINAREPGHR